MITTGKNILDKARKGKYAVGAFNTNNMEITQAIINAAAAERSPLIISTTEGAIDYAGIKYLAGIIMTAAEETVPVAMHLDHGKDISYIRSAIRHGYTSVMIDGSSYPYEENVKVTRKIVNIARRKGVSVEGELGTIGGVEDKVSAREIIYTDPGEAYDFWQKTGVDSLAVAVGTSHGAYKFTGRSHLDIRRLKDIAKIVKIPLVLHGASGVPMDIVRMAERYGARLGKPMGVSDTDLKKAVREGVSKVNEDTDLRLAFDAGVRKVLKTKPEVFDPRKILSPARDLITEVVRTRMRILGSRGKAR